MLRRLNRPTQTAHSDETGHWTAHSGPESGHMDSSHHQKAGLAPSAIQLALRRGSRHRLYNSRYRLPHSSINIAYDRTGT